MADDDKQVWQGTYSQILRCATTADIAASRFSHARRTKVPADMMLVCDALRNAEDHARAARDAIERIYLNPARVDTAETVRAQESIPAPAPLKLSNRMLEIPITPHCSDCGEEGVTVGHMGCQFPQDHD
jgi:hypothetical protein